MRAGTLLFGLMLSSAVLLADDRTILFDPEVDFSTFKTFALRDGTMDSQRPELNSAITIKKLTDTVRGALIGRGLKESPDPADLVVEYSVKAQDFGLGIFGRANPIGSRGRGGAQASTPDFTDATLVIDLKAGDPRAMVWRGVYRDTESTAPKLADALPKHATKLLSEYPPKKKKA